MVKITEAILNKTKAVPLAKEGNTPRPERILKGKAKVEESSAYETLGMGKGFMELISKN